MNNQAKAKRVTAATNRKARHEYHIEETWEAGIVLKGSEVKSLRASGVSMGEGYIVEQNNELWMLQVHINEYPQAGKLNHVPTARRKLLLHRREVDEISRLMHEKGRTCIPLEIYFNEEGRCKVEIGTATGKKLHDKRDDLKSRDAKREMDRIKKSRGADE